MSLKFLSLAFFVAIFSSLVVASPLTIEFDKENYYFGETVQGKMFFNESLEDDIKSTDFSLNFNESSFDVYPILVEFEDYIYFYFDIPISLSDNYDLVIEDVIFVDGGILVEEDQSFDISMGIYNGSILTVDPGIIIVNVDENNWFSIEVGNPSSYVSSVDISSPDGFIFTSDDSFSLSPLGSKNVQFYVSTSFADKSESSVLINYGNLSYSIPIFIDGLTIFNETAEINDTSDEGDLKFEQRGFDLEIEKGESSSGFVKIANTFDIELMDVGVSLSEELVGIIDIEFKEIESIGIGEEIKNHLYINEDKSSEPGEYRGTLDLEYNGEIYDSIPLYVNILEEIVVENNVSEDFNDTREEEDELDEEEGNTGLFIGILIFVVVIGLLILIKYKKSKKKNKFPY